MVSSIMYAIGILIIAIVVYTIDLFVFRQEANAKLDISEVII